MKTNYLNEEERINALWLKIFTGMLAQTAHNNKLVKINSKFPFDRKFINSLLAACNDLMSNDRSNIPHYLKKVYIENPNNLKGWLDSLKDDVHFSDEEVELLYNDYRRAFLFNLTFVNQKSHK